MNRQTREPALDASHLTIGYGARVVAADIALSLAPGTVTCLLGPNGVGKTTLFRTLLGVLPALSGEVRVGGRPLAELGAPEMARRIAHVPQTVTSDFAYSALDMVVMGRTAHLGVFAAPRRRDIERAGEALAALGIGDLGIREFNRLSGGQRQLVLIARALAQEAPVIFMDEPTASLDLANRLQVLDQVRALAVRGFTLLISTHEPEQAFAIADRVAVLEPGGRLLAGPPREVLTGAALSRLYGVALEVETTPSGRHVVVPAA